MVGVARIELATPAMSTQCSTTELHAHTRSVYRCRRGAVSRDPAFVQALFGRYRVIFL